MTNAIDDNPARCFLRSAQPEDASFLFRLFVESQEHLAPFRSNAELYKSLIEMQYRGRKQSYADRFPGASDALLCIGTEGKDELPVGRLLADCRPDCWRIVDIAVLIAHRGRELGTWALRQFLRQAEAAGAGLALEVRPENPARRLYERLGFRVMQESVLSVEMEYSVLGARHALRTESESLLAAR
jgi:ribosomal protein S18 acetylase RimI-like enzyme